MIGSKNCGVVGVKCRKDEEVFFIRIAYINDEEGGGEGGCTRNNE